MGQEFRPGPAEIFTCGMARLMASSTVQPGLAERASPARITVPPVVGDSGLPPGSVDRSNGRDVAPPRTGVAAPGRGRKGRGSGPGNVPFNFSPRTPTAHQAPPPTLP